MSTYWHWRVKRDLEDEYGDLLQPYHPRGRSLHARFSRNKHSERDFKQGLVIGCFARGIIYAVAYAEVSEEEGEGTESLALSRRNQKSLVLRNGKTILKGINRKY
ncbi:hypothetical protein CEXT_62701 [Caerostris extrusa]|uniref:Uncharacterized protein n=1 Tax=Caerostris extrusa TaxID=172846 RepID=A0AAV4QY85_CAEEX|nr:hypothetical protein CEXT_62701 [Caerostris extrusa]